MDRRALIVGAPYNDLPGVRQDIVNYTNFLLSPLGGAWRKEEISVLDSPTHQQLSTEIKFLQRADYSFVVFSGHGYHPLGATSVRILLRHAVEIDSNELRIGARKHALILDCCRKLETETVMDSVAKRALRERHELNPNNCRKFFDIELSTCGDGLVVLHACGLDELASETASQGGYYSRALTSTAREWESSPLFTSADSTILFRSCMRTIGPLNACSSKAVTDSTQSASSKNAAALSVCHHCLMTRI